MIVPAQAADLRVLSWNTFMLPAPIKFSHQKVRKEVIAQALKGEGYDFIFMEEAFTKTFRSYVGKALKAEYPHQYYLARKFALKIFGSGVYILGRHPFKVLDKVYYKECGSADCFARKGSVLIESTLPSGKVVQFAVTHLQAIEKLGDVRMSQLKQVKGMLDKNKKDGVPQFLIGDLNIDRKEPEFDKGLALMDMKHTELTGPIDHTNVIECYKNDEHEEEWIDHMWVNNDVDLKESSITSLELPYEYKGKKCNASDHLAIEGLFTFAD
jgi:endonuclease/exonuclease/phosphatase family metal-dependent hydrolase